MAMPLTVPTYTVEQLEAFPEDGQRYELLEGILLVTPAPGTVHEILLHRLHMTLGMALDPTGLAHIVQSSELLRGRFTRLQPDLLVYPSGYGPGTRWTDIRDWWLAVEVFSRSSRVYDREFKTPAYLALGVAEVWLVDPEGRQIEIWNQAGRAGEIIRDRLGWRPPALNFEVAIDLVALFQGV